ncbi:MAG: hypothetical protein ACXAC5_02305 [Promethearchaeota archaeon]
MLPITSKSMKLSAGIKAIAARTDATNPLWIVRSFGLRIRPLREQFKKQRIGSSYKNGPKKELDNSRKCGILEV